MIETSCVAVLATVIAVINCKIIEDKLIRNDDESWSQQFSNNWIRATVAVNKTSLPNLKMLSEILDASSVQYKNKLENGRNDIKSFLRQIFDSVHIEIRRKELGADKNQEGHHRSLQLSVRQAVNKLDKFEFPFKTSRIQLFLGSMPIGIADLLGGIATIFSAVATGLISAGLLTSNLSKRESISRRNLNTRLERNHPGESADQYIMNAPGVSQTNNYENYSPYSNYVNNQNQPWPLETSVPVYYGNSEQIYNPYVQNYHDEWMYNRWFSAERERNNFDGNKDGLSYSSAKSINAENVPSHFLSPPANVEYDSIPYEVDQNLLNSSNAIYFPENQASHPDFPVGGNDVESILSEESKSFPVDSHSAFEEPTGKEENPPRNMLYDPSNVLEEAPTDHQVSSQQFPNQHNSLPDVDQPKSEDNQVSSKVENLEKLIKSDDFPGFPYTFDSVLGPRLSRIDSIFQQLNLTEEECKQKMICSIYKSPMLYSPISEMLSHQISIDIETLKTASVTTPERQRFATYLLSARVGSLGKDCDQNYTKCSINTKNLATYPMINTYNHINHLIRSGKPTLSSQHHTIN